MWGTLLITRVGFLAGCSSAHRLMGRTRCRCSGIHRSELARARQCTQSSAVPCKCTALAPPPHGLALPSRMLPAWMSAPYTSAFLAVSTRSEPPAHSAHSRVDQEHHRLGGHQCRARSTDSQCLALKATNLLFVAPAGVAAAGTGQRLAGNCTAGRQLHGRAAAEKRRGMPRNAAPSCPNHCRGQPGTRS